MSAQSKAWWRHPIIETKKWNARRKATKTAEANRGHLPLREFLYLDAVSLHSLLVSQNATIPESVSQAISRSDEAEISVNAALKAGSDLVGAASTETSARYQTSNSNSTQSSRKAVIQTLFKELRELPLDFKLAATLSAPEPADTARELTLLGQAGAEPARGFTRGTLVEVQVELAVDPVFKLGTMMTEWTAMADDLPQMFGDPGIIQFLRGSQPIMKVLDRFLAGLIPIRATATDHVVAEIDGAEYVVHRGALGELSVPTRPLQIVGVTEHIGYWRDIRRVLFSNARVTVLCRVARDGLQTKWTPVKLADLFSEVAPDFVDIINEIEAPRADRRTPSPAVFRPDASFAPILLAYAEALIPADAEFTREEDHALQERIAAHAGAADAASQRSAFESVRDFLISTLHVDAPPSDDDQRAREAARRAGGLQALPPVSAGAEDPSADTPVDDARLLDTEVIAIYW